MSRLTSAQKTLFNLPEITEANLDRLADDILGAIENLQSEASHSGGIDRLDELHEELETAIDEGSLTPSELQSIAKESKSISKRIRGPGFDYDVIMQ
ncbi:hypothetical protein HTZ84_09600 [Haloterrigena sp. SYSU A558-1]|uniref:Uncharacterized protein n=1 Tax=Haloterrigena gelatinilytica TaxID=2741724 RepID=A0ABX2LAY4_9EURY|nr:hypothetical protein [Haloterrigena gelatinilytica]NUC72560.1 hypothetical protein [Haloterrigena gelatinilytica]